MADLLPPLKPIPINDRMSMLLVEKGNLDVREWALAVRGRSVEYSVGSH